MYKYLLMASLLLLSSCTDFHSTRAGLFGPVGFVFKSECNDILKFYAYISELDYESLKAIQTRLTTYQGQSGCLQLKLAVLQSMPRTPLQNTAESARLLRDYLDNQRYTSDDERNFARMLLTHVLQTRRFLARQKTLKENVGDNQKQTEQLSEENEDLAKKLDQLKQIELDITRKEQSVINPSDEGDRP